MTRTVITRTALDEPRYEEHACAAIKAIAAGVATDTQQKLALQYIIISLAMTNAISFTPDALGGQRDTDFREGKRFVGHLVRKIVETPLDELVPK